MLIVLNLVLVEGVVSNNKVKIIAEVAWAHDGDLDKAKMLVKNASLAAVDIINFHITDIPSYITKDYGNKDGLSVSKRGVSDIYKFLLDNNICVEDINKLLYLSKKFNLLTSVMINDSESFSRLDCSLVDYMCIAPAIVDEKSLIDNIHFAFNKKLDTDYWKDCRSRAKLLQSGIGAELLEYYKTNNANIKFLSHTYRDENPFGLEGWWSLFRGLKV